MLSPISTLDHNGEEYEVICGNSKDWLKNGRLAVQATNLFNTTFPDYKQSSTLMERRDADFRVATFYGLLNKPGDIVGIMTAALYTQFVTAYGHDEDTSYHHNTVGLLDLAIKSPGQGLGIMFRQSVLPFIPYATWTQIVNGNYESLIGKFPLAKDKVHFTLGTDLNQEYLLSMVQQRGLLIVTNTHSQKLQRGLFEAFKDKSGIITQAPVLDRINQSDTIKVTTFPVEENHCLSITGRTGGSLSFPEIGIESVPSLTMDDFRILGSEIELNHIQKQLTQGEGWANLTTKEVIIRLRKLLDTGEIEACTVNSQRWTRSGENHYLPLRRVALIDKNPSSNPNG
jgi:hypothetical protein